MKWTSENADRTCETMGYSWNGDLVMRKASDAVEHGLDKLAQDMVNSCRMAMKRGPQTGRDYRGLVFYLTKNKKLAKFTPKKMRGPLRFKVRSSAPGEFPAWQSGDLSNSIAWESAGKRRRRFGTSEKHGRWLELGTKKMKPRPYLRMTMRRHTGRDAEVHFEGGMK